MSRIRHSPEDEPFFVVRSLAAGMANGAHTAPHRHAWHQLLHVRAGALTVRTDRGTWLVPTRWAVWAQAGTDHALAFHGDCRYTALYLRPRRDLVADSRVIAVGELLAALIARTAAIGMLDRRQSAHRAIDQLLRSELPDHSHPELTLALPSSPRLQSIAERILDAPGVLTDIDELAATAGISSRTLERLFVSETGISIGAWRRHARLQFALRRLAAGKSIATTAEAAGYQSASAFIAAFGAVFGTTPGKFFAAAAEIGP
ncbi:MAG: helix-turn-helix transcriptional regulator [Planctomycetes bacterium]|nr:helix-turn-helix transcriptional regulator [Planctomycetota bacterium]